MIQPSPPAFFLTGQEVTDRNNRGLLTWLDLYTAWIKSLVSTSAIPTSVTGTLPITVSPHTGAVVVSVSSFGSAASGVVPASGGGTTNFLRADGTWSAPSGGFIGGHWFGSGVDGNLVYDGSTTILGVVPSANTYALNSDVYGANVTVNSGVTVKLNGWRLFATGTLTNSGTISDSGLAGSVGTTNGVGTGAGAPNRVAGFYILAPGGGNGGGVGQTLNSTNLSPVPFLRTNQAAVTAGAAGGNSAVGGAGATGGIGQGGSGGGGGGSLNNFNPSAAGGAINSNTALVARGGIGIIGLTTGVWEEQGNNTAQWSFACGGAGGGGGGSQSGTSGGGGGGGGGSGGVCFVAAHTLAGAGAYAANGGNGGAGGNAFGTDGGGGGGGGGGSGGLTVITYSTNTGSSTFSAAGGTGGTGGLPVGTGGNGGRGGDGHVGYVVKINLSGDGT